MNKRALITGISGQDGSYLAELLLEKGYRSEVTKMRFRVRQLTGFDDIESRIDELI